MEAESKTGTIKPILPNPNATQNRLPSQQELGTLRSIAQSKAQLSENIQSRIIEASSLYEDAITRYQAQHLVLDSLLSEVHTTKNFIGTLEAQKKTLDDETNELRGIIHPVRRCSAEVLTHIFGMTTTPIRASDSIEAYRVHTRQIYQIMGVCRHWRDAALHCPTMWTAIPIRLGTPVANINSLWKFYVERVKHVPVSICLSNIGVQRTPDPGHPFEHLQDHVGALDICDMQRVPFISNLRLESPVLDKGVGSWLSYITHFPSGRVKSLSIVGDWRGRMNPPAEWWSWDNFLNHFPPLTNLEVQGADEFSLERDSSFPTVERLTLKHLGYAHVKDTLSRFPNVQVLHFGPIAEPGRITSGSSIELPCLTSLSIEGNGFIPWATISAPMLRSFCLVGHDTRIDAACGNFLASCPLLISAKLSGADNLHALALATNRIVHLSLDLYELVLERFVEWWSSLEFDQPFPQLKTLALNYTMSPPSTIPTFHFFQDLVVLRCLPHSNSKSVLSPSLSPLEVLVITHPTKIPSAWMDSVHYETATTRIVKRDPDHTSVTLSWVLREDEVLALGKSTAFYLGVDD